MRFRGLSPLTSNTRKTLTGPSARRQGLESDRYTFKLDKSCLAPYNEITCPPLSENLLQQPPGWRRCESYLRLNSSRD